METFFNRYNQYLEYLIMVECMEQELDYDKITASYKLSVPAPETTVVDTVAEEAAAAAAEAAAEKKRLEEEQKLKELEEMLKREEERKRKMEETPHGLDPLRDSPYDLVFEDGYYLGETKDGLMDGHGTRFWYSGKKWEGFWSKGLASGNIVVTLDDEIIYEGNMENGLPNGKGRYTDPDNGFVYEGNFVDFQRDGEGCFFNDRGDKVYDGEWKNDRYHGYGQFFMGGKCRYEGMWEFGKRNGQGVSFDANGEEEYNGEWRDNSPVKKIDRVKEAAKYEDEE